MDDVVIPDVCPCLGTPIVPGEEGGIENSPSVDRIDPSKGYVKDNVWVISYRANRIKNDSTFEELEKVFNAVKARHNLSLG